MDWCHASDDAGNKRGLFPPRFTYCLLGLGRGAPGRNVFGFSDGALGLEPDARGLASGFASGLEDLSAPGADRVTVRDLTGARAAWPDLADLAKPESSAFGSRPN